mmetsp:Transcript_106237/g.317413  ORF Transcript_106237/g.317413 Transcript_106237/m.317413 type:complete len:299 (-) Transcript_106237:252-1148(-)
MASPAVPGGDGDADANEGLVQEEEAKLRCPRPFLEIDTAAEDLEPSPACADQKISFDLTPLSCKSTDSSAEYHKPNQTIIIFDWDDTLCPSTTCMRYHGLSVLGAPPERDVARTLEELSREARALLEQAAELAEKVVVVTNAEEGWVDLSCKAWLPQLQSTLTRCEVASARSTWEPRGVASPAGWKARAFEDVIDKFYSRYQHQSWKNIISIGDAPHEREALSRVVRWAPCGRGKRCRSKSVKFILRPSIEQLTREIQMLRESLKEIVWHDDDLDLHFSAESLAEPLIGSPSSAPPQQ